MKSQDKLTRIVDFLFEAGTLARTPRSFTGFLGSDAQSVAEHTNRTVYIGYVLSMMNGKTDTDKIVRMCLFHDLVEARASDLNWVHQKYTEVNEKKGLDDITENLAFGKDIRKTLKEYTERKTLESKLAKEADNIEFIMFLKEQIDLDSTRAKTWIPSALKRLKTEEGKLLAERIMSVDSDHWWFGDKDDEWWVNRNRTNNLPQKEDKKPAK